jgi:hypothetical protein
MSPPLDAKDDHEGYCETCTDWYAWAALQPCLECLDIFCADCHGEHECEGAP